MMGSLRPQVHHLVVLAALACGDTGTASPSGEEGSPPAASEPAATPAGAASETPAETTAAVPAEAAATPSDTAGASGAGENLAPNASLPGTENTSPGGGTSPGMSAAGSDLGGSVSLARGADPTRQSATSPGPFPVATLTSGLRDGPDYGSQTLHIPQEVEPPLASVVIVPGFNTLESSIEPWGPFLASHGIVTLTIGTNNPTDSADARARAVLDALETIKAENGRTGSPLEGQLSLDHLGIMGWSLGGGGVLIAASSTPSLKAAITMAAFSPGGQFAENQVPTLFLAGSADPNAGGQSQGLFASLPDTTPKMLFEVLDGPHEVGNDPQNANGEIGRYGLSWLEVFLVGDDRYRPFLEETPTQASDFQQNIAESP